MVTPLYNSVSRAIIGGYLGSGILSLAQIKQNDTLCTNVALYQSKDTIAIIKQLIYTNEEQLLRYLVHLVGDIDKQQSIDVLKYAITMHTTNLIMDYILELTYDTIDYDAEAQITGGEILLDPEIYDIILHSMRCDNVYACTELMSYRKSRREIDGAYYNFLDAAVAGARKICEHLLEKYSIRNIVFPFIQGKLNSIMDIAFKWCPDITRPEHVNMYLCNVVVATMRYCELPIADHRKCKCVKTIARNTGMDIKVSLSIDEARHWLNAVDHNIIRYNRARYAKIIRSLYGTIQQICSHYDSQSGLEPLKDWFIANRYHHI